MTDKPELIDGKFELANVLTALRREIVQSIKQSKDERLKFKLKNIEVELQTVITEDTTVEDGAGVKLWVLDVSSKVKVKTAKGRTHKIKLTLEAQIKPENDQTDSDENSYNVLMAD